MPLHPTSSLEPFRVPFRSKIKKLCGRFLRFRGDKLEEHKQEERRRDRNATLRANTINFHRLQSGGRRRVRINSDSVEVEKGSIYPLGVGRRQRRRGRCTGEAPVAAHPEAISIA